MADLYTRIHARARELEPEIARFLCDLIRTPSHSTKEKEVVAVIDREMRALGFDEVRVDGLGSIIGRVGRGKRLVAFDAHIDTVYPGDRALWRFDPFDAHIADGRVWGRGASDQKGGLAAMVYAGKIMKEMDLAGDFTVLFTGTVIEEDCDGLCWKYLVEEEQVRPEAVVITEPTSLRIHRGQRGRMEMMVHAKGVSCHGSAPERGDNAVYKVARIALEIEKLNARLADDPFLGKGTVTVTQVFFSSPSACSVPDAASIQLDRRLTVGETIDTAVAEVREACRRAGHPEAVVEVLQYAEPAYTGKVFPMQKYFPTWVTPAASPYVQAAVAAYRAALGAEPVVDKWTFSTNGIAIAGLAGIPCLGLGPGHEKEAHAPNESCPVDHLGAAAAFYAAFMAQLNGR